MSVQLPDFASLGTVNPQPATAQPVYPQESPQAQSEAVLGKGVEAAAGAVSDIDLYQQLAKDKLEEANATVDLFSRVDPLKAQIAKETDPAKVAELKQQANDLLATSGQAIANPLRRQMWTATHTRTVGQLGVEADTRNTELGRGQAVADIHATADKAVRTAVGSDDPQAVAIAQQSINDLGEYGQGYGALTPEGALVFKKQQQRQLYLGRARTLINGGQPDQAIALLNQHSDDIDPITMETLIGSAQTKGDSIVALRAVNQALGRSVALTNSGGMAVGGAIPQRVADVAQSENVDPAMALATAHTESRMGQNLGSRGNIFQLGKTEWASVGGGSMSDTDTQIKNGVAFLSKTQQELTDKLGRDPTPAEIYLAHQQGVAGATALLSHPDTPAGQLVGDKAISANGGDPNAPASAFVSKWQSAFNHNLSLYSGGVSGEAAPASSSQPVAIGDSIAAHLIRKAGASGQESGKVGVFNAGDTAVSGYSPSKVLDVINSAPAENIKGRDVVLSTGVSNGPGEIDQVPQQIQALKDRGARTVTLLGVGTADKLKGANDQLAQIATQNGATFAGPLAKVAADGIHSSSPDTVLDQAKAAIPQSAPMQQTAPITRGQAVLAATPDYLTARDHLLNDSTLNDRQRNLALTNLTAQFHQETTLYNTLDAKAHQQLTDQQKANDAELLSQGIQGKLIAPDQLSEMVRNQRITEGGYKAYQAELQRQGRGQDDISVFNDLDRRARAGEDVNQDIMTAVDQGKLKGTTALSLQKANDARKQKQGDQIERYNFSTLRTVAGMDAQEHPMVDLGREAQQAQVALWGQAQQEWNRRVHIAGEDSNVVLADMLPRYGHQVEDVNALPRPRLGAIGNLNELADVAQKTQAAREAGDLNEAQFSEERDLIVRYKKILDAQATRAAAAASAPKPGSDAARGRVKMQ